MNEPKELCGKTYEEHGMMMGNLTPDLVVMKCCRPKGHTDAPFFLKPSLWELEARA